MHLDHVVVWVADPGVSVDFYTRLVGLEGVRVEEFRAGRAPFPSVRVGETSIIDLTPMAGVGPTEALTGAEGTAGHPVNHLCLAMDEAEYRALDARLADSGVATARMTSRTYGARGWAPEAFYFSDPDGNVVEARYYG